MIVTNLYTVNGSTRRAIGVTPLGSHSGSRFRVRDSLYQGRFFQIDFKNTKSVKKRSYSVLWWGPARKVRPLDIYCIQFIQIPEAGFSKIQIDFKKPKSVKKRSYSVCGEGQPEKCTF